MQEFFKINSTKQGTLFLLLVPKGTLFLLLVPKLVTDASMLVMSVVVSFRLMAFNTNIIDSGISQGWRNGLQILLCMRQFSLRRRRINSLLDLPHGSDSVFRHKGAVTVFVLKNKLKNGIGSIHLKMGFEEDTGTKYF